MARHAGFGVVATFRQGDINRTLEGLFKDFGPFYFPLPQTITVGPVPVTFGGIARIAAPVIELHPNPQDLITIHFAFFSTFNAQIGGGPPTRWRVRLDVAVDARFLLGPQSGQIVLSLDTSTITFQPLSATFLQGPPPSPEIISVLQSPQFASVVTTAVRALPMLPITNLMPTQFSHTQLATFKESNFSVFNWFTVTLTVSRVELRVFEGAVTIAADFAGITNGDRNALVDLTRTHGGGVVYVQTVTQMTNPHSQPILVPLGYDAGASRAFTLNIDLLGHIVADQVSPQVAGTPVSKEATLNWIRAGYSGFEKPLRGNEDGLELRIGATAKGIDASINVYIQPFLHTYDGPTNFIRQDAWLVFVARVDIDLPWWYGLVIGIAQVLSGVVGLVLTFATAITLGKVTLFDDFMKSISDAFAKADPDNIAVATQLTVQDSAYDAKLPQASYISINPDGIDVGYGSKAEPAFALPVEPTDGALITPDEWSVYDQSPILTNVQLNANWQKLIRNNLQAVWEVRRKDTNAVVVVGTNPYNAPFGNGVLIPHHSQALYYVSEFVVRCSLTMTLGSQVGEIWSGVQTIKIEDPMDRSLSFVEWGPKYIYFANAGTHGKYWTRLSRSRIHRTAAAARCLMLRRGAGARSPAIESQRQGGPYISSFPEFRYRDSLPFTWEELKEHRKELCEYCFFGGPDKFTPLPREDWFNRPPHIQKRPHRRHHPRLSPSDNYPPAPKVTTPSKKKLKHESGP